jgi:NAD(P)-dependent dehydrogenase (short-subunit alcohol dehydrogenase family)
VSDASSLADSIDRVERDLGQVTILVNKAATAGLGYLTRLSPDISDDALATNLRGPLLLACEVARRLIASGTPGRIINISSLSAQHFAGRGARCTRSPRLRSSA